MNLWCSVSKRALAIGVLMLVASPVWAQWHRDYESGKKALEDGDCARAVELIVKAQSAGPDAGGPRVRFFGMRYDAYHPYYYLAKAQMCLQQPDAAKRSLESSEQFDGISDGNLAADRSNMLAEVSRVDLAPRFAEIDALVASGRLDGAQTALERLQAQYPNQADDPGFDRIAGNITSETEKANNTIRRAEAARAADDLEGAKDMLQSVANIDRFRSDVQNRIRALDDEIQRRIADAGNDEASDTGTETPDESTNTDSSTPATNVADLTPRDDVPPPVTSTTTAPVEVPTVNPARVARSYLGQGRIRDAWTVATQAELPSAERTALEGEIRQAASERAKTGVRDIFEGNRAAAVTALQEAEGPLAERPMLHLYLALAYYRTYLYERDTGYLDAAKRSIENALELDPNVQSESPLFSPRFRSVIDAERLGTSGGS